MNGIDWNLARAFYTTAKAGSLSAAARELGLTQPTLSRQVAMLESELGILLFERIGKRLVLTGIGQRLLAHGDAMGAAADAMALAATGGEQSIEGRVSISATDAYCAYILPDICARIRVQVPQVTLVIISSNAISDLRRREADIAIRHLHPQEPELIGQELPESTAGLYASLDWVSRNGLPQDPADIRECDMIGYDDINRFTAHMRDAGMFLTADRFRLISENSVVAWEMVKQGLGIGVMMPEIANRTPGVVQLLPELKMPRVPVWLVTHREMHTSRRIRLVFDILADELSTEPAKA